MARSTGTGRATTYAERLDASGIQRLGSPARGFRYRHATGRAVSRPERERIDVLKIPPAWKDVRIDPRPRAPVQAMGRDRRGRWQYLYHPHRVARREREKAERLIRFLRELPRLRRVVRRDLRRPGAPREKVMAAIVRILTLCYLRPGSKEYAEENGSYGIATLRPRHVSTHGDRVRFRFTGKSGKPLVHELRDPSLARIIRHLLRVPGEVFKFKDPGGRWVDVRRRHINAYIKDVMGESFSAKDFRTWAGTLICACALARADDRANGPASRSARRKAAALAVRETAEQLGNTPAVCRGSYIHRRVLALHERGRVIDVDQGAGGALERVSAARLATMESALLGLLSARDRGSAPPIPRRKTRSA